METIKILKKIVIVILGIFTMLDTQAGINFIGIADGNWSNPKIWSTGVVPGADDKVIINGREIMVDVKSSCKSLILTAPVASDGYSILSVDDGAELIIYENLLINGGEKDGQMAILEIFDKGILTIKNDLIINSSTKKRAMVNMDDGKGKLNIAGDIFVKGKVNWLLGKLSYVNFNGTEQQNIPIGSDIYFANLIFNNKNGAILQGHITSENITGNIIIQSGKLDNNGFYIDGDEKRIFEITDGSVFVYNQTVVSPVGYNIKISMNRVLGANLTANGALGVLTE